MGRQFLGPARLAQQPAGPGAQFAQVELFGLAVRQINVPTRSAKALGWTDGFEAARPIAGPAILRLVNKALNHQHRMVPVLLPVGA